MFYTPVWFDITGSSIAIYNQKSYSDKYKSYFTSPTGQVEKHKYQWVVYEIEWNVQKYTMRILEWKKKCLLFDNFPLYFTYPVEFQKSNEK